MVKKSVPAQVKPLHRLRHPDALVFILGGIVGALVNFSVTWLLLSKWGLNPLISFFGMF